MCMCGASYIISLFTRHLAEPQNAQFYYNSSRGNSNEEQAQWKALGLGNSSIIHGRNEIANKIQHVFMKR